MAHTRFYKACSLKECTRMGFLVVKNMMTTIDFGFCIGSHEVLHGCKVLHGG